MLEILYDDTIYNDVLIWKISQQTELNFDRNLKKMLAMTASRLKSEATVCRSEIQEEMQPGFVHDDILNRCHVWYMRENNI